MVTRNPCFMVYIWYFVQQLTILNCKRNDNLWKIKFYGWKSICFHEGIRAAEEYGYNAAHFPTIFPPKCPIDIPHFAREGGIWDVLCVSKSHYVQHGSLQCCEQYGVILDRVITGLDCTKRKRHEWLKTTTTDSGQPTKSRVDNLSNIHVADTFTEHWYRIDIKPMCFVLWERTGNFYVLSPRDPI